jgi:LuxR family transcriptional regulator, maltose regulon positive regulatory protein
VASAEEDAPRTLALAAEARRYLAPGPSPWTTVLALSEGLAYDALGDAWGAERSLDVAATGRDAAGPGYLVQVATVNLGRVEMLRGRLGAAVRTSQRALDQAGGHAEGRSPVASYPHVVLGRVAYERNDLAGASDRFTTAIELASTDEHLRAQVDGLLGLARTRWAWLDLRGARDAIRDAHEAAATTAAAWASTQVIVERARLALRSGHVDEAGRLVEAARRRSDGAGGAAIIAVRVLAAQGLARDALTATDGLLTAAEAAGRAMDALELLVVRSLILADLGRPADARESLELALVAAEPEGFLRVFLDEAEPLVALLRNALADHAAPAYAADVLAAFAARPGPGPMASTLDGEPMLNEREMTVLQLLAARRSDKEIARAMGLSVSTVKWYAQRVFTKLGAHRRTEAVAHARERGLI